MNADTKMMSSARARTGRLRAHPRAYTHAFLSAAALLVFSLAWSGAGAAGAEAFAGPAAPPRRGDACFGAGMGKIPALTGEWKGLQRRWDAQGALTRSLESNWKVNLLESYPPALGIEASYFETVTGKQISQNSFVLVCSPESGSWTQEKDGFGRVELYARGDFLHHVVTASGPTGKMQSVSLFSFPSDSKMTLTSDWFTNGEYTGHTVNQMARVVP